MHEDKLTHDERLRLESVAQANVCLAGGGYLASGPTSAALLNIAREIEGFIRGTGREYEQ